MRLTLQRQLERELALIVLLFNLSYMKKSLITKVEVKAHVTYVSDGQVQVMPVVDEQLFERDASFRARVKVSKRGKVEVTPVREGKIGSRYDVLLDTSCGCLKTTNEKVIVQLSFPKKLGNGKICDLLQHDMSEIFSFQKLVDLEEDTVFKRA